MIRIAVVLTIVVSFWIVLPLSAGAGPDQFAQYHPPSRPGSVTASPPVTPRPPAGSSTVKSTPSSASRPGSVTASPRVTPRTPASSSAVKSTASSTSRPGSVSSSPRVTSRTSASSSTVKSTPSSTSQTGSALTSPRGTSQSSSTTAQAKSPGSAPSSSSSTPGSTSPSSQNTRGLDPARRYGKALNQGMYDPNGVPGSPRSPGSTAAADKRSQPSKTSADPAKTGTAWAPAKTREGTSGSGTTGTEAHHHRKGEATAWTPAKTRGGSSGSGGTGPEAHHHSTPGVPGPEARGFSNGPNPSGVPWLNYGARRWGDRATSALRAGRYRQ